MTINIYPCEYCKHWFLFRSLSFSNEEIFIGLCMNKESDHNQHVISNSHPGCSNHENQGTNDA